MRFDVRRVLPTFPKISKTFTIHKTNRRLNGKQQYSHFKCDVGGEN